MNAAQHGKHLQVIHTYLINTTLQEQDENVCKIWALMEIFNQDVTLVKSDKRCSYYWRQAANGNITWNIETDCVKMRVIRRRLYHKDTYFISESAYRMSCNMLFSHHICYYLRDNSPLYSLVMADPPKMWCSQGLIQQIQMLSYFNKLSTVASQGIILQRYSIPPDICLIYKSYFANELNPYHNNQSIIIMMIYIHVDQINFSASMEHVYYNIINVMAPVTVPMVVMRCNVRLLVPYQITHSATIIYAFLPLAIVHLCTCNLVEEYVCQFHNHSYTARLQHNFKFIT